MGEDVTNTGKYEVSVENFRNRMDCPDSYTNKHIMDKIIKPSLQELQNYFHDLKCETKYARKRGRPVIGYIFTFMPENRNGGAVQDRVQREKKSNNKNSSNGFSNFHQRSYDYDELEKILLSR